MQKTESMTKKPISYYDILRVSPGASDEDIHRAYRRMAKKYHPDNNPKNKRLAMLKFRVIAEAYRHLNSAERRRIYDMNATKSEPKKTNRIGQWFTQFWTDLAANENAVEQTGKRQ